MARKAGEFLAVDITHQFGENGVAVEMRLTLKLGNRFLDQVEQRALTRVLRQVWESPTVLGVLHGPRDAALQNLMHRQPPRPKSYREGGGGQKDWWVDLHRAAEATDGLRGWFKTWRELRHHVVQQERRDSEAEERYQAAVCVRLQEWEREARQRGVKFVESDPAVFTEARARQGLGPGDGVRPFRSQ
jgi:hypothetical protein